MKMDHRETRKQVLIEYISHGLKSFIYSQATYEEAIEVLDSVKRCLKWFKDNNFKE